VPLYSQAFIVVGIFGRSIGGPIVGSIVGSIMGVEEMRGALLYDVFAGGWRLELDCSLILTGSCSPLCGTRRL
jgi:hypothetical protein